MESLKGIQFSQDEIKVLVSFIATSNSNTCRYVMAARSMNEKDMFDHLINEKKILGGIMEKLLTK